MPGDNPQLSNDNIPTMASSQVTCPDSSFESVAVPRSQDEGDNPMPSSQTSIGSKPSNDTDIIEPSQTPLHEKGDLSEVDPHPPSSKRKRDLEEQVSREDVGDKGTKADFIPPSLRISLSFDGEAMIRTEEEKTPSPPKDRKSALRISMSSDGEALIRASNEASPSKDRVAIMNHRRSRFGSLQRSKSAISPSELASPSSELRGSKNKCFGRSRDSRTWELHCDTDARSALSASSSSHGHPTALSRSSSNRSLKRKSFSGNRNTLAPRPDLENSTVTPKESSEKRKLSRAVSSVARLQSDQKHSTDGKVPKSGKPTDIDIDYELGDSDKENWLPGTQTSNPRRRRPHGNRRRPVLQHSRSTDGRSDGKQLSTAGNKRVKSSRDRTSEVNKENSEAVPEIDEEVAAFMVGGSAGASQEEDLDCIQGLLSLSQGAWR